MAEGGERMSSDVDARMLPDGGILLAYDGQDGRAGETVRLEPGTAAHAGWYDVLEQRRRERGPFGPRRLVEWLLIAVLCGPIAWIAAVVAFARGRWAQTAQLAAVSVVALVIDAAVLYLAQGA
jgi:hypothetical protein